MLVTFTVAQFVPGGPVEKLVAELEGVGSTRGEMFSSNSLYRGNSGLSVERVEKLKAFYGFDDPPVTRFVTMMRRYVVFDFGVSYYSHQKVVDLVISKLPVSMSLGLWGFLIVYGVCVPLGIKKLSLMALGSISLAQQLFLSAMQSLALCSGFFL